VSGYPAGAPARGGRRRRPMRTVLIIVIVLIGVLVAADFGAKAFAQGKLASEIQSHGFPKKPDVSIGGFPFLTQLVGRDFRSVTISSGDVPEGPVTINKINAVLSGVRVNSSLSGGTVDQLTGTVFITFPELANALTSQAGALGSLVGGAGLTLTAAGSNEVKATVNVLIVSGSATWRITELRGNEIDVKLVSSSGLPSSLLSSVANIKLRLPALPLHLTIQSLSVTPDGINGQLAGSHLSFGS
jgi:LmeA-like phospholipid-binding